MRLEEVKSNSCKALRRLSHSLGIPKEILSESVLLGENQMSGVIGWATEIEEILVPTGVSKRDKTSLKKLNIDFLAQNKIIAGP